MSAFTDNVTAPAAGAALALSIVTLVRSEFRQKRLRHLEALQLNGTLLSEAWRQLADVKLLRFHSINGEELKRRGLSMEDLTYLIVLFETADYYYQHIDTVKGKFPAGSLCYAILQSPETRKA